jgi:hypothetical protein
MRQTDNILCVQLRQINQNVKTPEGLGRVLNGVHLGWIYLSQLGLLL